MKPLHLFLCLALPAAAAEPVTFLRDVAPILNKVGCTSGPCHGAAKGKNGFKLSLRGYDPEFNYQALLYDLGGRRFNRADPGQSLMLAKPAQQVPHGGGLRLEPGSPYYQTIFNWIAQGVPYGDAAKDGIASIEMLPASIELAKPEESQQIKVVAHFLDGKTRDVTKEAVIASNIPDVADVSNEAVVKGFRIGEATMLIRYEGKFGTVPVTVLNPKPGFTWKALPQNNSIDATFLRRVTEDLTGQAPTPAEVRAFLATPNRPGMIENLLARKSYVDHATLKWGDLLQNSRKFLGDKATWEFREWLRESVASNPPTNEALLDALTKDFKDHDYDLKHLIRTIVNSRVYQAGIQTNEWSVTDNINFSHAIPRRLNAEQLMDALTQATGVRPDFPEVPEDTRAEEFPDPHVGKDGFLDLFGRPQRETPAEGERKTDLSLPQALNLVNGKSISDSIGGPTGRIAKAIIAGATDKALIEELYMATLSRVPTAGELDKGITYLRSGDSRAARAQDLLWALVNSKAFLYNR